MKPEHKRRFGDIATIAAGAAVGGGLGYLAHKQLNKSYGEVLRKAPPGVRLKYLMPASTAIVGGLALSRAMKSRAKQQRRAQEQTEKISSFQRAWVIRSLTEPWQ